MAKGIRNPSTRDDSEERTSRANMNGRRIALGLMGVVIICLIAVVVAGALHWSARYLNPCPADLQVNVPGPELWSKLESRRVGDQPLGVKEELVSATRFKGFDKTVPDKQPGTSGEEK